jgi:uracil phosphoribosyltransferase
MPVHVVDHPLVAARLAIMRDERTDRAAFRAALAQIAHALVYEAARTCTTKCLEVRTPLGVATCNVPASDPCLIPITRAGLGMLEPALELFPGAEVAFVGLKKGQEGRPPSMYLNTVPQVLGGRAVFVLEPMVASGGSAATACELAAGGGAGDVIVVAAIASRAGLDSLERMPDPPTVVTAAIDEILNDIAFIVPGLGDAGDRQFGLLDVPTASRPDVEEPTEGPKL